MGLGKADVLSKAGRPNKQETNVGAVRVTKVNKVKASGKKVGSGFTFASQSSNLPDRPIRSKRSGNTFKAKPGAR